MKSIFIELNDLKEEDCEYRSKCPLEPGRFCSSPEKFNCVKYRELEEIQMRYDDDL